MEGKCIADCRRSREDTVIGYVERMIKMNVKMLIREAVSGYFMCAVAVGTIPVMDVSPVAVLQVQAASGETEENITPSVTPTFAPTQKPEVTTAPCVTAMPTDEVMSTPFVEVFVEFIDGEHCDLGITRPRYDEETTYILVQIIEPYEKKEGYRFLGWENTKGIYQPGEVVKVYDPEDDTFYAKWEKIEPTATPVATSTATADVATETPDTTGVVNTTSVTATSIATITSTVKPTVTPVVTNTPSAGVSDKEREEKETKNKTDAPVKLRERKATLKFVTKANEYFVAGKKYRLKVKRVNISKKVKWLVSNEKIAKINEKTGVLKTKKAGKVTISVTCGNVTKKITIRIHKAGKK